MEERHQDMDDVGSGSTGGSFDVDRGVAPSIEDPGPLASLEVLYG